MLTIEQTAAFIVSLFHPTEDTTADSNYTVPEIAETAVQPAAPYHSRY
jgi:hypothetical protein